MYLKCFLEVILPLPVLSVAVGTVQAGPLLSLLEADMLNVRSQQRSEIIFLSVYSLKVSCMHIMHPSHTCPSTHPPNPSPNPTFIDFGGTF